MCADVFPLVPSETMIDTGNGIVGWDNYRKCMDLMKSEVVITITHFMTCTRLSKVAIQVILPDDLKLCFGLLLVTEPIFISFSNLGW